MNADESLKAWEAERVREAEEMSSDNAGNILDDEDTDSGPFPHTSDRETE